MKDTYQNCTPSNLDMTVLRLSDAQAKDTRLVGGKAAHLAALLGAGFPVPDGIVITDEAFELLNKQRGEGQGADEGLKTKLSEDFSDAVLKKIVLFTSTNRSLSSPEEPRFAVRSSAVGEDNPRTSYAGVLVSYLNVEFAQVPHYALKCWRSSLSDAVKSYKNILGSKFDQLRMAVVVQTMINAKVAGIAFTAHPLTLDSSKIVITMCKGLGTDAVNGRNATNDLVIERRSSGLDINASAYKNTELPGDVVGHLGKTLLEIETFLGIPVDVEWAWDGQALWILQARPITTASSGIFAKDTIWSNTNLKEVLPDIPTPATWSATSHALDHAFKQLFRAFGYNWPDSEYAVASIWGRAYMNLSRFSDAAWRLFGIAPGFIIETLGGAYTRPLTPEGKPWVKLRLSYALNLLRLWVKCNLMKGKLGKVFAQTTDSGGVVRNRLTPQISCLELADLIKELQRENVTFMYYYLLLVMRAIGAYILLKKLISKQASFSAGDIGSLLTGLGDMPSVDMAREMISIAETALKDPGTHEWLLRKDWGSWCESLLNERVREDIQGFLRKYGHRTVNMSELEMASPRWSEDPGTLFEAIASYCANAPDRDSFSFKAQQQRRVNKEIELIRSMPFYLRLPARIIIAQAQYYARLRETAKSFLVHRVALGREVVRAAGRILAKNRAIIHEDDIFFLQLEDITRGLLGERADLRDTVAGAKNLIARFKKIEPADVFIGPEPYYPQAEPDEGATLTGMSVSPGKATAAARVLHDPLETSEFAPGEVLVCPAIDSSWIPLFFFASGIVAEIGGVLSHGAIIARELGIPTVINVYGATAKITDGQKLTVDGNLGKVFFVP
ncbi:MAG: PEP/pyruvate-binding domain-containing protein [Ktedonobacteraceae bacterium]